MTKQPNGGADELTNAIRKELDRHLIDANDSGTMMEYQNKAGYNKGLREAGVILNRCIRRGDFDAVLRDREADAVRAAFEKVIGDGSMDGHLGIAYRSRMDAVLREYEKGGENDKQ